MARNFAQHHSGFSFNYTDLNQNIFPPRDGCVFDTTGWADLDGDGVIDFVCIGTASGNYEDTDHEVFAIHAPSGNIMWRALAGQASKKLGLFGGVVIVSTNSGSRLRGLDARTGQELWNRGLEDAIQEDPYDGDNRAPAISPVGGFHAAYECIDETAHVLDVRNGQLVKSRPGKLHPAGWNLPGFVAFEDDDDNLEVFDVARNRTIVTIPEASQVRPLHTQGFFGLMHRSDGAPRGEYATKVLVFDQNGQPAGTCWVQDESGDAVDHGDAQYGVVGGMMLGGMKIVFGDPYSDEKSAYVAALAPNQIVRAQPLPPPRPGYQLKALTWCTPVVASVWQKTKGTERLICAGHDPNTLATTWLVEDLGGQSQENVLHTTGYSLLVPKSTDNYYSQTNPACMVQLDPQTGQRLAEYPVETVDTVGVVGYFLVGTPDYFSGGVPVAYDTWRRIRVL